MAVSPKHFSEHLAVIRRYGTARTLSELARHLYQPGEADCSIAVTLDDGYADNLVTALPLLEAERVPATVYVIADAIGDPAAFWWDRLTEIFLANARLPRTPCPIPPAASANGSELDAEAECSEAALARLGRWNADYDPPTSRRQRLFLAAWAHVASLPAAEAREAIAKLCAWAGVLPEPQDALSRPMTKAELRRMAEAPLIEIGGHGATHADLSALTDERAAAEIDEGRKRLVALTGQRVNSFAYPFGRVGARTPDLLRAAGFANATCSRFGIATDRCDPFLLPRLHVRDCSGPDLERLLAVLLRRRPAPPTRHHD